MCIVQAVSSSDEAGGILAHLLVMDRVMNDHVCPQLIDIAVIGIVDHIRQEAARRAHIDLKADDIAFFTNRLILQQTEKFKMEESAACIKGFHTAGTGLHDIGRNILIGITADIFLFIDSIHNTIRVLMRGHKQQLLFTVCNTVKGKTAPVYVFLHNHSFLKAMSKGSAQLIPVFDFVRITGTYTDIRLDYNRISDKLCKFLCILQIGCQLPAGGFQSGSREKLLHAMLALTVVKRFAGESGFNMEISAQRCILTKPVFIV